MQIWESSKGVVGRKLRRMGFRHVVGIKGAKVSEGSWDSKGGLRVDGARRGGSWCPDTGSVAPQRTHLWNPVREASSYLSASK
jgi:hypothetical protein